MTESGSDEAQSVAAVETAHTEQGAPATATRAKRKRTRRFWTTVLEHTDALVYILVGICFFLAALFSLGYGITKFGYSVWLIWLAVNANGIGAMDGKDLNAASAIIAFVSDLLLTLIIMEVMGTVVHYLRTRETSLKPFLFIGIVSATRGVLAVGARLSVGETSNASAFTDAMIELGVNAAVIIALGVTMRLIGTFLDERNAVKHHHEAGSGESDG